MGLVVLGTVTVTAIPVLGDFGARPDNLTLLPRNYVLGWFVFAALVLVVTVVAALRAPRRHDGGAGSAGGAGGAGGDGA